MGHPYKKGFGTIEKNLLKAMEGMEIIDGHEHIPPEEVRTSRDVDVFTLFCHYTRGDLMRAGMSLELFKSLFDTSIPLDKRWKDFAPYWENIRHTSYSRAVLIAARKFYGAEDINGNTYWDISEKMKKFNRPGIYRKVLKEACRIKTCLNQCGRTDLDRNIFTPVMPLIGGFEIVRDQLTGASIFLEPPLKIKKNREIKNLDDYVSAILEYIAKVKKEGAVGLKMKSLPYSDPDRKKAAAEFSKIRQGRDYAPMTLDSYVIDRVLSFAEKEGMPIAVHTGYWGDFRKLHPLHVIPLLQKFPRVRFDIYHLGYPWVRDTLMLAKGFSNVWLNFCWTYIISEKCAAEALDEAIDTVPSNRIIGFGGDYNEPVEEVYGHLVMARESMAKVLGRRIKEGTMTENQALVLLKKWFWDNPVELYRLKL